MLMYWFIANIKDIEARRYTYAAFLTCYVWKKELKKWTIAICPSKHGRAILPKNVVVHYLWSNIIWGPENR